MTPGEVVMLTVRCQEFMFHCQLTSNIANRTSDGLQQLFRQQADAVDVEQRAVGVEHHGARGGQALDLGAGATLGAGTLIAFATAPGCSTTSASVPRIGPAVITGEVSVKP